MNFQESLDYLYSLGYELSVKKFGLENTFTLLNALENPEKEYLKVQIAGTNGKGSTCAFLESICVAADISVGKYTSPHLISITERICVNGREISEKKFAEYATLIRNVSEKLLEDRKIQTMPTFFEQVTAIALKYFADEKIEIAILETGLGGRFDATTAAKAEIVAFTPIDLDHQHILGNTLSEIASEKAAIIRPDTKVFSVKQKKEAEKVILGKCIEAGVELTVVSFRFHTHKTLDEVGIFPFQKLTTLIVNNKVFANLHLKMLGNHQFCNAALAVTLSDSVGDFGFKISEHEIKHGLETATNRGRLEFYKNILFDGAHNISGATALRQFLLEEIKQPITMIFGAMKDKDLSKIGETLFPLAETLILTKPDNPRAMEPEEILNFVPENFDRNKIIVTKTVDEALKIAPYHSTRGVVCVTGSLYLVGEVQKILKNDSEF